MNIFKMLLVAFVLLAYVGCDKKPDAFVHFKVKFDPLQERLNANGIPSGVTAGKSAQTPVMNSIGINSIELLANANVAFGNGVNVFNTTETVKGDSKVIELSQVKMAKDGEIIVSVPTEQIAKGKYEWIRIGVAYENFDIQFNLLNAPSAGSFLDERGTMAVVTNANNYISKIKIFDKEKTIDSTKKQGFWLFESKLSPAYAPYNAVYEGHVLSNSITFVNPLYQTSPISKGSNVITGRLDSPLSILGNEEADIDITLSFSSNKIFEWDDSINRNGKWDFDARSSSGVPMIEQVTDVGLRGLKAYIQAK